MKGSTDVVPGVSWYCIGVYAWIYPFGIPVPITGGFLPIFREGHDEKYDLKTPFDKAKVFEMKKNLQPKDFEKSVCFAIVEADTNTAPFWRLMGVYPEDLNPGKPIRAFSRAKIYFKGWAENLRSGRYQPPNLNYPFWGAKLAPLKENTYSYSISVLARGAYLMHPVQY